MMRLLSEFYTRENPRDLVETPGALARNSLCMEEHFLTRRDPWDLANDSMKTTAAVLVETGQPLEIVELETPALRPGQVLVEVAFSGVCHTQLLECRGHRGDDPYLPHCLGHEASGVVRETGPDVTRCEPGDRVILSWIKADGRDVPGTTYDWNGRVVNSGGVTTFSRHTVVSENRVTPMPVDLDLRDAALVGCAVATGAGSVFNTATMRAGERMAVFGVGGIGLCAVMAARALGTEQIIAVDPLADRRSAAEVAGATLLIDASADDPVKLIRDATGGGVDIAVEASGRVDVMRQALQSVRPRGGRAVVVGNARQGETLSFDPVELNQGKQLRGTWGGDTMPDRDFPRYCEMIADGRIDLSPLKDAIYPLAEINRAIDDLEAGRVLRPLIDMSLM